MIASARKHVFDLLAADARLYRSGPAWGTPWLGVKRIENGDKPAQNYVNLFDDVAEADSTDFRPAVYAGMPGMEATDALDFPYIDGYYAESRVATLPLVIIANGTTKKAARQQRDQLLSNIRYILLEHPVETGYWWAMETGGPGQEKMLLRMSATGGGAQGTATAQVVLPVCIKYSFQRGGTDA